MAYFKTVDADGVITFGIGASVPPNAQEMTGEQWLAEREAKSGESSAEIMAALAATRPVSLFSARKILRDTKAADGKSYMEKIKSAHAAGDLSDDAAEALEMLDPVTRNSAWVSEIQSLFTLSDGEVDALFERMRAVQV